MSYIIAFLVDHLWYFPLILFLFLTLRYLIISSCAYFILWKMLNIKLRQRLIQKRNIKPGQIQFEIKHSLISFFAMAIVTWPLFWLFTKGKTAIYLSWGDMPWWMVPIGVLTFFFWHDVYFYWSHRWLHSKWAFKKIHFIHHTSKVPTPFDSYCFHWFEGVLQILFIYPLVIWLPMHPWTFVGYMAITAFFSAWGHFNYELMPLKTWTSWWGSWVTTSTHHNMHHQYNSGNLALYLKFWDKRFGTLDERTEERFLRYSKNKL